jgi:hypothetical protein
MADQQDGRSHNQPSHEAQVKGGQHSHSGAQSEQSQPDQKEGKQQTPDREESAKGGQHSHAGGDK